MYTIFMCDTCVDGKYTHEGHSYYFNPSLWELKVSRPQSTTQIHVLLCTVSSSLVAFA